MKMSDEDALNRLEKMGIEFKNADFKNKEWIELDDRNKRKKSKRQVDEIDLKANRWLKSRKK